MITSLKAILAGSLFIVSGALMMGLLYIFLAVGFNSLAADWPALHRLDGLFRYLLGIPALLLLVFAGGYISALIARHRPLLHGLSVALLAGAAMLLPALENARLTVTGMVVFSLLLVAGGLGGHVWQQSQGRSPDL